MGRGVDCLRLCGARKHFLRWDQSTALRVDPAQPLTLTLNPTRTRNGRETGEEGSAPYQYCTRYSRRARCCGPPYVYRTRKVISISTTYSSTPQE